MLFTLSKRLRGPHPNRPAPEILSEEELNAVTYDHIDVTACVPKRPTHKGYVIIGGSGWMGHYLVKILLLRGETSIRILDLTPPKVELLDNPAVGFIQTDMTSRSSVETGLLAPFASTGKPPSVIFHCAANIRFWERASYTYQESYRVNVWGTQNIIDVAHMLPEGTLLIYTSSSDVLLPRPQFMKLGKDYDQRPYNTVVFSDADPPLDENSQSSSCYARSKIEAEQLILKANEPRHGLKTASLRPGQTITGPNDRMISSALTMPRVPVWDKEWSHTNVCVWDVVAAHLLLEDALEKRPHEVEGQAFLITGKSPAWTMRENRNAAKFYSTRTLVFDELPVLIIYILAHLIEILLYIRYHILLPFFLVFAGSKPSVTPKWMGEVVYLQPATLEYMRDVVIDDSRARKILGYRPQWTAAQAIRYTVEQVETGAVNDTHGLQLK